MTIADLIAMFARGSMGNVAPPSGPNGMAYNSNPMAPVDPRFGEEFRIFTDQFRPMGVGDRTMGTDQRDSWRAPQALPGTPTWRG